MKSELVKSYQRSLARLRRIYKPYAEGEDFNDEITAAYRRKRAEALTDAMNARVMEDAWSRAFYPNSYAKEHPHAGA